MIAHESLSDDREIIIAIHERSAATRAILSRRDIAISGGSTFGETRKVRNVRKVKERADQSQQRVPDDRISIDRLRLIDSLNCVSQTFAPSNAFNRLFRMQNSRTVLANVKNDRNSESIGD